MADFKSDSTVGVKQATVSWHDADGVCDQALYCQCMRLCNPIHGCSVKLDHALLLITFISPIFMHMARCTPFALTTRTAHPPIHSHTPHTHHQHNPLTHKTPPCMHTQAAVKAERRKLKQMRAQALDQRCARAIAALSATPLPQPLLLNLALKDTDAPRLMPAVAFRVLYDPPLDAFVGKEPAREPFLACLAADNRLVAVSVAHVVGVGVQEGSAAPALGSPAAAAVGSVADGGASRSGVDSSNLASSSSALVEGSDGNASSSGGDAAGSDASSSSSSSSSSSAARTSSGASTSSRVGNSSSQGTTAGRAFWQAKLPELEAAWDQASAKAKAWSYIAAGSPGVQLCVGSSATAQLAVQIGGVLDQYDPVQVDPELAHQVSSWAAAGAAISPWLLASAVQLANHSRLAGRQGSVVWSLMIAGYSLSSVTISSSTVCAHDACLMDGVVVTASCCLPRDGTASVITAFLLSAAA